MKTIIKNIKRWIKSFHFHKYTTLIMYAPRPDFGKRHWGFLKKCECGKHKLTRLSNFEIERVEEAHYHIPPW